MAVKLEFTSLSCQQFGHSGDVSAVVCCVWDSTVREQVLVIVAAVNR